MAKFYIQSGNTEFMVAAADAEGAALWFVNRIIHKSLPANFNVNERGISDDQLCLVVSALDQIDPEILISEVGFGRDEVGRMDTELVFKEWFTLVNAMNALFDQL